MTRFLASCLTHLAVAGLAWFGFLYLLAWLFSRQLPVRP